VSLRSRALLAAVALAAAACTGINPVTPPPFHTRTPGPTPRPNIQVAVELATATPTPALALPAAPADAGLRATLADYTGAVGDDPAGDKTDAFITLQDFTNPRGTYAGTWWLRDDNYADIYEVLAVILYTEGNTNWDVRTAVAARYLWYCGGAGTTCQGHNLINFLSYFQPWREPWVARGFTSEHASKYEAFATELVQQKPGLLTVIIPGADAYIHSPDGLSVDGSIDWSITPFHFANVDASWDAYLRQTLRRSANGPARLWVLTMNEAARVCRSRFLCDDMTQPRAN
jgi:hypothetical protein